MFFFSPQKQITKQNKSLNSKWKNKTDLFSLYFKQLKTKNDNISVQRWENVH